MQGNAVTATVLFYNENNYLTNIKSDTFIHFIIISFLYFIVLNVQQNFFVIIFNTLL